MPRYLPSDKPQEFLTAVVAPIVLQEVQEIEKVETELHQLEMNLEQKSE